MKTKKKPKKKLSGPTWTTKDGSVVEIAKMDKWHLLNTHRHLRRQSLLTDHVQTIVALEAEIHKRGLMPLPVYLNAHDEAGYLLKARYLRMAMMSDHDLEDAIGSTGDIEF